MTTIPSGPISRAPARLVLAACLFASPACDRVAALTFSADEEPEDSPVEPAEPDAEPGAAPRADPPSQLPSPTSTAASPDPASSTARGPETPPPAAAASVSTADPFTELATRLCTRGDATTQQVDALTASAWRHYKAKAFVEAAADFACVSRRDPGWKHAFNVACASARAGVPDDARIALAEAIDRDREAASRAAKRDADLASVRSQPWFAALLDAPPEERTDSSLRPGRCPPELPDDAEDPCWFELDATFTYVPLELDTVLPFVRDPPRKPEDRRWTKLVGLRIDLDALRATFGLSRPKHPAVAWSTAPMLISELESSPVDGFSDDLANPFWWWPQDGEAVLVIPLRHGEGRLGVNGAVVARRVGDELRGAHLPVVIDRHQGYGGASNVESGIGLRAVDGAELFTLSQVSVDGASDEAPIDRQLCRIRGQDGALVRACISKWIDPAP